MRWYKNQGFFNVLVVIFSESLKHGGGHRINLRQKYSARTSFCVGITYCLCEKLRRFLANHTQVTVVACRFPFVRPSSSATDVLWLNVRL